jgi:hypothetical protein
MTLGPPGAGPTLTVVGVVPDTRYRDLRQARPSIYFPVRQLFFPFVPTTFAVRTSGPPDALAAALRGAVERAAPGVAVVAATPFDRFLERRSRSRGSTRSCSRCSRAPRSSSRRSGCSG